MMEQEVEPLQRPHPKEGLTQPESVSPSVCHSDTSTVTVISTENRKELSGDGNVMSEADCHLDQEKNSEDKAYLMSSHLNERDLYTSDQIQDTRTRCEDSDYRFIEKTNIENDAIVMSSRLSADERDLCTSGQIQDTRTLEDSDYHFDHKTNVEDIANERDLSTSGQIQDTRTLEDSDYHIDHKTNVEDSADERDLCTSDQIQGMRRGCGVGVGLSSTGTTQSDCSSESPRFACHSPVQVTNPYPGSRSPSEKNETDHHVRLPTPTGETGDKSPPTKRARLDDDVENSGVMGGLELVLSGEMACVTQRDLMNDDGDHHAAASVSLVYNLSKPPLEICHARTEFSETHNYLKGCKWSPDGSCLLTCSNDCRLRLFNLPEPLLRGETSGLEEMKSVLRMKEGETIYDYAWYPLMSSADPPTCCLVSTSGNTPVHMWDAFTGGLRCSYRAFNQVDEVVAAYSLSFSSDGNKLYCGFNKMIRVFDVERPGRRCQQRPTYVKEGQAGIISCIVTSPSDPGLYAAGSYSRSIALYHEPKGDMACMFQGQQGGVTHLQFTPDGTKLLSGGRKDCEILCWDLRHPGRILFTLQRDVQTNQRVYFDVDSSGRYLVSGNHDGTVRVWDMCGPVSQTEPGCEPVLEPELTYQAHDDTVNGASFHPSMPLIATSSGQRHFEIHGMDSEGEETEESTDRVDNSVRLWYI